MNDSLRYVFRTVETSLREVSGRGSQLSKMPPTVVGFSVWLNWHQAINSASSQGLSLDQSLSFDIASGIQTDSPKYKVLFWISTAQAPFPRIVLWASCAGKAYEPEWMMQLRGLDDWGRGLMPANAIPFLYWNGTHAFRVYGKSLLPEDNSCWVQDFGNIDGPLIYADEPNSYDRLLNNPAGRPDRSAISTIQLLKIKKGNDWVAIEQAFINLINTAAEGAEK